MLFLASLLSSFVQAHPAAGQTSVVVVMKMARCTVCQTQMRTLADAKLGAPVVGVTHEPRAAAIAVAHATGVPTYSHQPGIASMGLWLPELGIAQPAVVVYDKCGDEAGRVVGRRPGVDVTEQVRDLVKKADAVESCGPPLT